MIETIFTFLMFIPLMLLFLLINLSEKDRTLENPSGGKALGWVSYGLLIFGFGIVMLIGFIYLMLSLMMDSVPADTRQEMFTSMGLSDFNTLSMGLAFLIPAIIGLILLIPAVRRGISRLIPINPHNRLHAISLSLSVLVIIQLWMTLAIGLENMSATTQQMSSTSTITTIWVQDLSLFFIGLLGVGLFTRRSAKETFKRLGIVRPTLKQVGFGIGIAIVFIGIVMGMEQLAMQLGFGIDEDVNELTDKLIGPLVTTIPGVLTLGLAAAIGEETIFRGAMQPKFGLILTSVLFAITHANYGFSLSTLIVLLIGLALGIIRNRTNTSTSMVVHATYNMGLGFLSYFQIM
ncbi:CPBP family intramembrane glutamic endopeptidase [Hazenella coriacea]|uniref:CAAX prenyl protease-like protein n=1 Tax=Hazenella coriacea TaxID=1179467 RepID=A0A4R3L7R2_9BACL|nr:type II CAAX endopeptidase family protein [Hazenella coriacea]TCS95572.1 CAAX prenyl protease-like protein [Hazenella coriacea]